ncbi:hypothetical protein Lal_00015669 [Lupinus albus]|nr:hypothetical protein Lal_00015669 [Lupinus albus]
MNISRLLLAAVFCVGLSLTSPLSRSVTTLLSPSAAYAQTLNEQGDGLKTSVVQRIDTVSTAEKTPVSTASKADAFIGSWLFWGLVASLLIIFCLWRRASKTVEEQDNQIHALKNTVKRLTPNAQETGSTNSLPAIYRDQNWSRAHTEDDFYGHKMQSQSHQGGQNKTAHKLILPTDKDRKTFGDVAGQPEALMRLKEVCDWLRDPEIYNRHNAKLPHGILLVGPPGTGKTLLARALAGEADASMFVTAGTVFVEMYVGVGAARVRALFEDARNQRKRTNKPVIIFIDEIDAVGGQRGGSANSNSEREQTLNQLLIEMDGFTKNEGIIVLAATNRSDMLDAALKRKGRFDVEIFVDLPDLAGREKIFRLHSADKPIASEVDFELLARRTFGFSGADIEAACNEAAIIASRLQVLQEAQLAAISAQQPVVVVSPSGQAVMQGGTQNLPALLPHMRVTKITTAIFDEAISIVESGEARKERLKAMKVEDKQQTAYHELGHAVTHTEGDRWNLTRTDMTKRICSAMAGRLAQEIFMQTEDTGASGDFQMAYSMARKMVTQYGMSKLGPLYLQEGNGTPLTMQVGPALADAIDAEVRAIITAAIEQARQIIESKRDAIELICPILIERETLLGDEFVSLLAKTVI